MARRSALGYSGLVGTVVLYEMNGNQYLRARPRKIKGKRSVAVRSLNNIFGKVSQYGSAMLGELKEQLRFPFNLNTYNQQRGWMRNQYAANKDHAVWELKAKNSQVSNLNPDADLRDFWEKPVTVTDEGGGAVSIQLPALNPVQDIKAPLRTQRVNIRAILVTSPFGTTGDPSRSFPAEHGYVYQNSQQPAHTIRIDSRTFPNGGAAGGDIAILVLALEFVTSEAGQTGVHKETRWLPAAIVAMGKLIA